MKYDCTMFVPYTISTVFENKRIVFFCRSYSSLVFLVILRFMIVEIKQLLDSSREYRLTRFYLWYVPRYDYKPLQIGVMLVMLNCYGCELTCRPFFGFILAAALVCRAVNSSVHSMWTSCHRIPVHCFVSCDQSHQCTRLVQLSCWRNSSAVEQMV
jgi:hypothetical protein